VKRFYCKTFVKATAKPSFQGDFSGTTIRKARKTWYLRRLGLTKYPVGQGLQAFNTHPKMLDILNWLLFNTVICCLVSYGHNILALNQHFGVQKSH
jgi:hypothetical protein